MGRRPYFDVIAEIGEERAEALGRFVAELSEEAKGVRLREEWTKRLGDLAADLDPQVTHYQKGTPGTVRVERFGLQLADGITLPVVLMWRGERNAMTVLLAQQGKAAVVRHMSERIEALLQERAVCLVDVRGTGEIGMEEPRGARSKASGRAATALMVGDSILGMQIRDLRSVIGYLRTTGIEDIEIEDVERIYRQVLDRRDELFNMVSMLKARGLGHLEAEKTLEEVQAELNALRPEGYEGLEMPDAEKYEGKSIEDLETVQKELAETLAAEENEEIPEAQIIEEDEE